MNYIDYLPNTIEELEFGVYFNLKLDNCPSSIKKIIFTGNHRYHNYNEELNCLPDGLSILGLPYNYKHQIKNIPRGLTKLVCSKDYSYQSDFVDIGIEVEIY